MSVRELSPHSALFRTAAFVCLALCRLIMCSPKKSRKAGKRHVDMKPVAQKDPPCSADCSTYCNHVPTAEEQEALEVERGSHLELSVLAADGVSMYLLLPCDRHWEIQAPCAVPKQHNTVFMWRKQRITPPRQHAEGIWTGRMQLVNLEDSGAH